MLDEREPTHWLNYKGDRRGCFDMLQPVGQSTMNEFLWPLDATYDPETNMTRVGLTKAMPPQLLPTKQETDSMRRIRLEDLADDDCTGS